MEQFVIYILKVNGLLFFFWLFYKLYLQKETFYTLNRFYFLFGVLIAFVLPLITITKVTEIIIPTANFEVVEETSNAIFEKEKINQIFWYEEINWWLVIFFIIGIISITKIGFRLNKIKHLINYIHKLEKFETEKNIRITTETEAAYSFYKWIIIPKVVLNKENASLLIQHEKVHIKQKHTFDLLLFGFIHDLFWFNPIIQKIQQVVNLNLEYIVDEEISKKENSYQYQKTLLNYNQNTLTPILTNAFNTSDLKKRILMMHAKKSKPMKKLKIVLTAPALLIFFGLFQIKTIAQVKEMTQDNTVKITNENSEILPLYSVAEVEEINGVEKGTDDFFVLINNKYDDIYFSKMKNTLRNEYNIDLDISEIKRNDKGELYSIKFKWNNGTKVYLALASEKSGISPFHMHVTKTNNNYTIKDFISESKEPLYIVDNKEISESEFRTIAPNDIISIKILKDEAISEKYGIKAKNGVLLITTNRKKTNKDSNEKNIKTVTSIFKELKKNVNELEDDNIKITDISSSITQEDGTIITISEKF